MKINNVYLRLFLFMGVFVGVLFFGKLNTQAIAIAGDSNDELNYEVTSVKVENDTTLVVEGWFYVSFRPYNGTSGNYGYTLQLYEGGKSYPNSDDKPYVDHTSLNSGALGETLPYRNVGFKFKVPLQELIDTGKSTFNLILTHTYKGKADIKRKLAYINDVSSISTKAYSVEFIKSTLSDKLQVDLSHVYARTDQSKGSNLVYINGYGPYYYIDDTDFKLGKTIWKRRLDKDCSSWFETKTVTGPDTPDTDDTGRMLKRLYPSTNGSMGRYVSGVALNATLNDFKFAVSLKKYSVTFKDYNGNTLKTQTVEYGKGASAPSNPSRVGYTFIGWDKDFSKITGNTTVTAKYKINQYEFDLNATLDGTRLVNLGNFGTADVYINGVLKGNDISDWCTTYDYNIKIVIIRSL